MLGDSLVQASFFPLSRAPVPCPRTASVRAMSAATVTAEDSKEDRIFRKIYPVYVDKTKSVSEGRKISKAEAFDHPMARDIAEACAILKFQTRLEVRPARPPPPAPRPCPRLPPSSLHSPPHHAPSSSVLPAAV